jgi:hypothetical protein
VARPLSDIPVGTQFSPGVIDLRAFLKACIQYSGDRRALERAVIEAPVRIRKPGESRTPRMGRLPLEAAAQYGLLTPAKYEATELTKTLVALDDRRMYDEFARHILLECNGLRVVEGAQQMALDQPLTGVRITGDTLAQYLSNQGLRVTIHNTAINSMRMWLAKAGLFPEEGRDDPWRVDEGAKQRILGVTPQEISAIASWSVEHRALALALCRMSATGTVDAADVRALAEVDLGRPLPRGSLPQLFQPLASAGYVRIQSGGTKAGKSAKLEVLPAFKAEVLGPFIEKTAEQLDSSILDLYKWDATTIKRELASRDTFKKGLALEAYAVRIMRLLGLRFVRWRERSNQTGGAEVDVILSGLLGGIPTRWQVQCKNTPSGVVRLDEVAKEVGLAPLTKATHILIVANCGFTRDAYRYARAVMENTALTVYLLGANEFARVLDSQGGDLPTILREQAERIAEMHRKGVEWMAEP